MWKRRSQCEWDQVGGIGRTSEEYCTQKDAYETYQTSNDEAETLATTKRQENVKRDGNAKVDIRCDTQKQFLERTLTMDNECGAGFQEDH